MVYRGFNRSSTLTKLVPSLTNGTLGNERLGFITKFPRLRVNKLDITSNRSDVVLTGRNRRRGTLIPKYSNQFFIDLLTWNLT